MMWKRNEICARKTWKNFLSREPSERIRKFWRAVPWRSIAWHLSLSLNKCLSIIIARDCCAVFGNQASHDSVYNTASHKQNKVRIEMLNLWFRTFDIVSRSNLIKTHPDWRHRTWYWDGSNGQCLFFRGHVYYFTWMAWSRTNVGPFLISWRSLPPSTSVSTRIFGQTQPSLNRDRSLKKLKYTWRSTARTVPITQSDWASRLGIKVSIGNTKGMWWWNRERFSSEYQTEVSICVGSRQRTISPTWF